MGDGIFHSFFLYAPLNLKDETNIKKTVKLGFRHGLIKTK